MNIGNSGGMHSPKATKSVDAVGMRKRTAYRVSQTQCISPARHADLHQVPLMRETFVCLWLSVVVALLPIGHLLRPKRSGSCKMLSPKSVSGRATLCPPTPRTLWVGVCSEGLLLGAVRRCGIAGPKSEAGVVRNFGRTRQIASLKFRPNPSPEGPLPARIPSAPHSALRAGNARLLHGPPFWGGRPEQIS